MMYESRHKAKLVEQLISLGLVVDARMQGPGSLGRPDIIAAIPPTGRTLVVELKRTHHEHPTDLQRFYLGEYERVGALAFIVRGDDFTQVLKAVRDEMKRPSPPAP